MCDGLVPIYRTHQAELCVSVKQVQPFPGLQGRKPLYLLGPEGVISTGYMMMGALEPYTPASPSPPPFLILNRLFIFPFASQNQDSRCPHVVPSKC